MIDSFRRKRPDSRQKLQKKLSSLQPDASVLEVPYSFKNDEIEILFFQEVSYSINLICSIDHLLLQDLEYFGQKRHLELSNKASASRSERKSKI